jgi:sphingosine kinase
MQDVSVLASPSGDSVRLTWRHRGSLVSCWPADVLAVSLADRVVQVHHYPLVKRPPSCCCAERGVREYVPLRLECASAAAAQAAAARIEAELGRRPRHLAVLVNPAAGSGRGLAVYRQQVQPLLELSGVRVTLTVSERRGHASEVVASLDLAGLDGLLVVSGDGTLSEVYAGLAAHPQREAALHFPLGVIPAGSGNAVAKSLAFLAGEDCSVLGATLGALTCTSPLALDVASVTQADSLPMYALLSLSWGLVADIDVESEALRFLAGARFTVQALVRCLLLRRYTGRLLFRPADAASTAGREATPGEAASAGGGAWRVMDGPLEGVWALNVPFGSLSAHAAPGALPADGCFHLVVMRGGSGLAQLAALSAMDEGSHVAHSCITVIPAGEFVLEPGNECSGGTAGMMVVDGELAARRTGGGALPLRYGRVRVMVHRGGARLLVRPLQEKES